MPKGQEIKDLYNKLNDIGAYTRTFEEFYNKYGSEEGMSVLYEKLASQPYKGKTLYTGDLDSFNNKYYTHLKKKDESVFVRPSISGDTTPRPGIHESFEDVKPFVDFGILKDKPQVSEKKAEGTDIGERFKNYNPDIDIDVIMRGGLQPMGQIPSDYRKEESRIFEQGARKADEEQNKYIDFYTNSINSAKADLAQMVVDADLSYRQHKKERGYDKPTLMDLGKFTKEDVDYTDRMNVISGVHKVIDELEGKLKAAKSGKGVGEALKFKADNLGDIVTLGWKRVADQYNVKELADRMLKGEELSNEEQMALTIYGMKQDINRDVEVPVSYDIASGVVEMLPFMANFMLTGGISTATEAGVSKALSVTAQKTLANYAKKGAAYLVGKVPQAATFALGYERTASGMTPGIFVEYDKEGKAVDVSATEPKEKWAEAHLKGLGTAYSEVATEGLFTKLGNNKIPKNLFERISQAAGRASAVEQFAEEMINEGITGVLIEGESPRDVYTLRNITVIAGTVGVVDGTLSFARAAGGNKGLKNENARIINESGTKLEPEVKKKIDNAIKQSETVDDFADNIEPILDEGIKGGWTAEEAKTAASYIIARTADNMHNELEKKATESPEKPPEALSKEKDTSIPPKEKAPVKAPEKPTETVVKQEESLSDTKEVKEGEIIPEKVQEEVVEKESKPIPEDLSKVFNEEDRAMYEDMVEEHGAGEAERRMRKILDLTKEEGEKYTTELGEVTDKTAKEVDEKIIKTKEDAKDTRTKVEETRPEKARDDKKPVSEKVDIRDDEKAGVEAGEKEVTQPVKEEKETEGALLKNAKTVNELQDLLSSGRVKFGVDFSKRMHEVRSEEFKATPREGKQKTNKNSYSTGGYDIPVQPSPSSVGRVKTFEQMLKEYSMSTDKVIRFRKPKGARGYYSPASTVTVSKPNDIRATVHEIGHSLDDKFNIVENIPKNKLALMHGELYNLARTGSRPGVGIENADRYIKSEGVAEWTTAYLVNPAEVQRLAPEFSKHFINTVDKKHINALNNLSKDLRGWFGLSAAERMSAVVDQGGKRGVKEIIYDVFKDANFKKTPVDSFIEQFLNPAVVREKGWREAVKRIGLNIEEVRGAKDFVKMSRVLLGHNNKIGSFVLKGMENFNGEVITDKGETVTLDYLLKPILDVSSKSEIDINNNLSYTKSIGIAQRTIELHDRMEREQIISDINTGKLPPQSVISKHADIAREYAEEIGILIESKQKEEPFSRYDFSGADFTGAGGGFLSSYSEVVNALGEHESLRDTNKELYNAVNEALRRYRFVADKTLQYAVDGGRISQNEYNRIKKENAHYISFSRLITDDTGEIVPSVTESVKGRVGVVSDPIKQIKGSRRTIADPYVSLIDNMSRIVVETDRNAAMLSFTDILDINISREIGESGMIVLDDIGRRVDKQEGKNVIKVFKGGEPLYYEFNQDIYESLKEMGQFPSDLKWITHTIGLPIKILERSVTSFPVFAARNRIRDFWARTILTQGAFRFSDMTQKKKFIKELNASGGGQFGYHMHRNNYNELQKDIIRSHLKRPGDIVVDAVRLSKNIEKYQRFLERFEQATRAEEYKSVYNKSRKDGLSHKDASVEAAYAARDLMDFAVQGKAIKYIKWLAPFMNPRIQGFRKMVRAANEGGMKSRLNFAKHFVAYGLVPLFLEKALIKMTGDDDDYNKLPAYRKYLFLNIPNPFGDGFIMIPKPFEIGVMASLFTRPLDKLMLDSKEEIDKKELLWLFETLSPLDPSAITGTGNPMINAIKNRDPFRQRDIIPAYEQKKPLELRTGTKYASNLAQNFKKIGVDPRKADYLIESMLPYWGRLFMTVSDAGREDKDVDLARLSGFYSHNSPFNNKDYVDIREYVDRYNQFNAKWYKNLKESVDEYYKIENEAERKAYREELNKEFESILQFLKEEERIKIEEQRLKTK